MRQSARDRPAKDVDGDLVTPGEGLVVEFFESGEGARREEAGAHVAPRRATRVSGEMIVGGEFKKARVEVDRITATLQNHATEIVGFIFRSPFCAHWSGSGASC